ncbi:MAG: DUF1841 family protein [Gammaproteobacteria bacterium]|nr:DUF1841 family protein [Gammaproteobacteria bacterium]
MRRFFMESWRKHKAGEAMEPLEKVIAQIVEQHPEYHGFLDAGESAVARDFHPQEGETNPFMHLGMHIAIHEQLSTARPAGIMEAYQGLVQRTRDPHEAEHRMMECLSETLYQAQMQNREPDEQTYLDCVRKLAEGTA